MKLLRKLFGLDRPSTPTKGRDRDFDLKGLERILKYQFQNASLARTALTHRSYLHATPGKGGESNERMEFLGDSVVGLAVNEFLYNKFPKLREGELTKMKSLLVSRVILSRTANQMGLGHYVLLSEAETGSGGRNRASILADTLEGVIGAVYLDGGLEPAKKLTERLLLGEVHEILSDANLANYKSMLQEYVQGEFKTHPQYRISSEMGPDHQKLFAVEVVVSGKTLGRGHGSNKKEAEQEAARDALLHFEKMVRGEKEGDARRRRRRGGRGRRGGREENGGVRESRGQEREHRGPREHREFRDNRDSREGREGREPRESRENRENREGREGRETREPRGDRPGRSGRDRRHRDSRRERGLESGREAPAAFGTPEAPPGVPGSVLPEPEPWNEPRIEREPEPWNEPQIEREPEPAPHEPIAHGPEGEPRPWEPAPERVRPEAPQTTDSGAPREVRYGRRPRDGRNRPQPRPDRPEMSEITREESKSPAGETAPWVATHLHTEP